MYLSKIKIIVINNFLNLIRKLIAIGSAVVFFFPTYSLAASSAGEAIDISMAVYSPLLTPTYSMSTSLQPLGIKESAGRTYSFTSQIEFIATYPVQVKGDLYFGIILPNNQGIFSWVKNGSETNFKKGLFPIIKGLEREVSTTLLATENTTFSLSSELGGDIKYVVTGQEPTGMYLVFSLLVSSGSDPSQNTNWIGVEMRPLLVK